MVNAPLYNIIKAYGEKNNVSFHMPGHKYGKGFENINDVWNIDITELDGTDNWANPNGDIGFAQSLAAKAYNAKETFFLVNGSSSGVEASVTAVCQKGDYIIADRSAHSSFLNACTLLDLKVVYANNKSNAKFSIINGIEPATIEALIKQYPMAKAIFITSPNYYGICNDIESIAKIVHKYDKILIVDEAHGSHFAFSKFLPTPSTYYADIVINSAHKTLPAPTQTGFLHLCTNKISAQRLHDALKMFTTSSPSYIFMCYLDFARAFMELNGKRVYSELKVKIDNFNEQILQSTKCKILDASNCFKHDFSRLVINFAHYNISGYTVGKVLHEDHGIDVEMCDSENIVCIVTPFNDKDDLEKLRKAINEILEIVDKLEFAKTIVIPNFFDNSVCEHLYEAWINEKEYTPLEDSVGKICGETVSVYPPNVPIIILGEKVTRNAVFYIQYMEKLGAKVVGIKNNKILTIK